LDYAKWPAQTVNYTESHDTGRGSIKSLKIRANDGFAPTATDRRRTHLMAAGALYVPWGLHDAFSSGQDFLQPRSTGEQLPTAGRI